MATRLRDQPDPDTTDDVAARATHEATRRYLMYVLLPAWFVPGVLDWWFHRRTDIEHTSGLRESLVHSLMMAEVGVSVVAAVTLDVDRRIVGMMAGTAVLHEATAAWDVRMADTSTRELAPREQLVHSFLESIPFMALSSVAILDWDAVRRLPPRGRWLRPKEPPLPARYLAGIAGAVAALIAAPYGEELLRCWRARRTATG